MFVHILVSALNGLFTLQQLNRQSSASQKCTGFGIKLKKKFWANAHHWY